jgi:hypothetical protein
VTWLVISSKKQKIIQYAYLIPYTHFEKKRPKGVKMPQAGGISLLRIFLFFFY